MHNLGFLVLVAGIAIFVLFYGMRIKARRNERLADLYQQAIDKGLDPRQIQFEFDEREQGDPQGNLKAGIFLLATALAIVLGMFAAQALSGIWKALGFVLVPAALGIAALFIHYSVPRGSG
jgi:hypothetical protein